MLMQSCEGEAFAETQTGVDLIFPAGTIGELNGALLGILSDYYLSEETKRKKRFDFKAPPTRWWPNDCMSVTWTGTSR